VPSEKGWGHFLGRGGEALRTEIAREDYRGGTVSRLLLVWELTPTKTTHWVGGKARKRKNPTRVKGGGGKEGLAEPYSLAERHEWQRVRINRDRGGGEGRVSPFTSLAERRGTPLLKGGLRQAKRKRSYGKTRPVLRNPNYPVVEAQGRFWGNWKKKRNV